MKDILKQLDTNMVKVVLFGPESTGKTTLSEQLARHYHTVWVPEFARDYLQQKWNNHRETCTNEDLLPIAIGQIGLENELVGKADKVLICDTDLLETKVYSEVYYGGYVDPDLESAVKEHEYDLYLLTDIDIPWEADDLRDRPNQRQEMFDAFKNALILHNKRYILVSGNKKERLSKAVSEINQILKDKKCLEY